MRAIWLALALLALAAFGCGSRRDDPAALGGAQPEPGRAQVADTLLADAQPAGAQVADTLKVELTYGQRKGGRLYTHYCAVCHGTEGAGDGFNAWNLDPKPRDLSDAQYQRAVTDEWLAEIIDQGGRGVSRSPLMPAWGHTLTQEQIGDVTSFVRTLARRPTDTPEGESAADQ
jgi:mono/diheme cytochrome c family protein